MSEINDIIESGSLELYVVGALSEKQNAEITAVLKQYPEIEQEVNEIENALLQLSAAASPYNPEQLLDRIKAKLNIGDSTKVIPIQKEDNKTKVLMWLGWVASIALLIGIFSLWNKNKELEQQIEVVATENKDLETQISESRASEEKTKELLAVLRDRNIQTVELQGQQIAPEAFAAVHWDKENNRVYIDAKHLPTPPEGKEYQVWSLTLEPLTPTSIGLLSNFESDENKIFILENINLSEGFGITLEPKGGSATPTLEQLYTLGTVG
ncbi:anti-sigma factor domain-containing protein [Mesonia sp. K7]|uniref:anti-sigma factor n=1 Tax=Mesonia sp. K7 TaxID=2218606 RepID=UPI000DA715F5|nr:anti-sigma factor [Mesonia sp. K7]PZD77937.1 anti-sigma factor [Mesonia sp. K7]